MGVYAAGQIVSFPFPYSDLSRNKIRPALLIAEVGRGDWIVCQITSNPYADDESIPLLDSDFIEGGLQHLSFIRPSKLLTANQAIFRIIEATVKPNVLSLARSQLISILSG